MSDQLGRKSDRHRAMQSENLSSLSISANFDQDCSAVFKIVHTFNPIAMALFPPFCLFTVALRIIPYNVDSPSSKFVQEILEITILTNFIRE